MEKLIGLKEAMNQQIQKLVQEKVDDQEEKNAPGYAIGDLINRMQGLEKIGKKLTVEEHRNNGMELKQTKLNGGSSIVRNKNEALQRLDIQKMPK